jgi:twitching motility two-component system response regulator PilG
MDDVNLGGARVLVIDDSTTIQYSARIFLARAGCQVILSDNGFDALSKIESHPPDIIFVDVMMPRLDGYQTCAMIRKRAKYRGIPIVMLTGNDSMFDRARGRMAGANDHLAKPFTMEGLIRVLKEQLATRQGLMDRMAA